MNTTRFHGMVTARAGVGVRSRRVLSAAALGLGVAFLGAMALGAQEPAAAATPAAATPRFVVGTASGAAATDPTAPRSSRQARVEVDEGTRTLFVTTDPRTNEQVRQVIEALEKPIPQALIKVLFLEVTHTDDQDVGVDFTHAHTEADGDKSIVSSLYGVAAETDGGIVSILQNDLEATLRAIGEVSKMNVLSRPSILASNNEEATITIGQEVPFIRNSRITDDGQTINTIEYEDIGIILTVTPHIGADGLIALDVAPEISTLTGESVPISDTASAPVFAKRSAETHVVVPSGRTAVIGGLMDDQQTKTITKVPLLGDIPWLGALFRHTVTEKSKTELLIFLTPTLVDTGSGVASVTESEQRSTEIIHEAASPETLKRYLATPAEAAPATP